MSKRIKIALSVLAGLSLLAILVWQIPAIRYAVAWRYEKFTLYVKYAMNPPGPAPTPIPVTSAPPTTQTSEVSTPTATLPLVTSTPTREPLPSQVTIASPPFEQQTPNNCGPATLSMTLHLYGWDGSQADIAAQIKPVLQDRNVNPEELAYYVRNFAGWLDVQYRVAGDLETLKRLLAANYPVIVESVTSLDPNDALGPTDDLWAAHYLLLTGYNDDKQAFTIQDSYHGADLTISYEQLASEWEPFNNLFVVIYFLQDEEDIRSLLGNDWNPDANRQRALEIAQADTQTNPKDAFAWFNLGSNLVYFERYSEAALAYDQARQISLPLRMFRYQFGPFLAYFHANRNDDLLALTDYARGVTEMSEEAWLWYGWALYRQNNFEDAKKAWNKALSINESSYVDARIALQYVTP